MTSHMAHIREHMKYYKHKIYSYNKMGKLIDISSNIKCTNNNNSTVHVIHIQKSLLMSIVDTP